MFIIYIVVHCYRKQCYCEEIIQTNEMTFKNREAAVQFAVDKNAFLTDFDEWYEVQELYLKES